MIILKVTKDQGFTFSLEDTFFKKLQGGGQIDTTPPPPPPPRCNKDVNVSVKFLIL